MNALLQIALVNALTAGLLALVVAPLCKVLRRPPLTRALWVLVLLKLVTPPIWSVPIWHRPVAAAQPTAQAQDDATPNSDSRDDATVAELPNVLPPISAPLTT